MMSLMSMMAQQYCLKWNNHTNNMVKVFNQLLDDQDFCDVTLAVDGTFLKAHKLVLSACSSYFKDLFVSNPCKHPIVILKDIRLDDLKAIINFMYCGEVNVSQNQLAALLKTAEILKVKGLTEVNDKQTDSLSTPTNKSVVNNSNNNNNSNNKSTNDTQLSSASLQPMTPMSTTTMSGVVTRKKRRRRANHTTNSNNNNNTSLSGESDTMMSGESDDSCCGDESLIQKKSKDNNNSPLSDTSTSRSAKLSSDANVTNKSTPNKCDSSQVLNIIQTRRRQQSFQQQLMETAVANRDDDIDANDESLLMDPNSEHHHHQQQQRVNNGNQLEPTWPSSSEHSSALALTINDDEEELEEGEESNDMFDVKPIVSFDDSSSQMSNALVLREDSSIVLSSPTDPNMNAGPSSAQTGGKRRSLRSMGYQSMPNMRYADSRSECPFCNKRIVNLRRHINEVHVGVLFQCQICCRKFKRKDKLNNHLISEHNI
ncbi:protein tramtrack, beta isoform-like [Oppia nitens]|uniref:protein tramtrack, beta isoform-like n=1 Tax=Oppia nitens TaxID=1686743 RepID=UPI0023DA0CFC|nr:protein tramtrack, beta isoform-like [Oppia nitens]